MKIVQATNDNLTELMSFYSVMCDVLGEKSFLPNGDKGGFPSQAMVEESIKGGCQFIGIEDNKIVAAYILNMIATVHIIQFTGKSTPQKMK